jgi:hypothetical protein
MSMSFMSMVSIMSLSIMSIVPMRGFCKD